MIKHFAYKDYLKIYKSNRV